MTTYFFATLVTQVPIGLLVDRIGAKLVLTLGLALHGGAVIAAGMAHSFEILLVAFLVVVLLTLSFIQQIFRSCLPVLMKRDMGGPSRPIPSLVRLVMRWLH